MVKSYTKILRFKMIVKVLTLLLVFAFSNSYGQAILQWNTFGNAGTETTEPSVFNDANLSATNLTFGAGITSAANVNRFGGSSWATSLANAISGNDYIQFIVTPTAGCSVTPTSFIFNWQTSNAVFTTVTLRSSADGFAADIGSQAVTTTITQYTITIPGITNNPGPLTFRLYGYGGSVVGTTTGGFDIGSNIVNVQLNGSTSCGGGCTAPTTTITPTSQTVCTNVTTAITVTSSATSPTYQWQMSASGGGPFINVANGTPTGVTYTGATTASLSAIGTASAQYFYQCLVTDGGTCTATSNTVSLTIKAGPAITTQPVSVSTTSTGTASYTVVSSGTTLSYQWQQSSGGAFGNINNGGTNPTYAGATGSVLTISNPPLSMSGYSYQCIVANTCGTVTTNGSSILTVTVGSASVCPHMTGAFINACDPAGGCDEGDNEILFFNSGSYSISVSPANIIVKYGSVNPPTDTYTDGFVTNAAQTSNLNAAASASCANLFVDASVAGVIPANSVFIIVPDDFCFDFDFSTYCGAGTIYILYSSDATYLAGGNFVNDDIPGDLRYFRTDFSAIGAGCVTNYNYEPNLLTLNDDGDAISFPSGGGAASAYFNNGCTPPPIVLPIELLDFYVTKNEDKNTIVWKVASEENVVYYTIGKSNDGVSFTEIDNVYSTNSTQVKSYNIIDESPFDDITYYRLGTKENDGKVYYHKIISVDEKSSDWNCIHYQQEENLMIAFKNTVPKNSIISLFDLSGKQLAEVTVKESQTTINTQTFAEGIYFLKISTPYKTENFKIIISK